jgi:hypothetical protein
MLLWMGLFSWILSQLVHCLYSEKLSIFVGGFYKWLCFPKCLWDLGVLLWIIWSLLCIESYHLIIRVICLLPICISFISFSCLSVLARNFCTILNKRGESRYLCLIPDFRGARFSFSPFSMVLAIGFSYIGFILLRYFPTNHNFFRAFIMKWCWVLSKGFFCINWNDCDKFCPWFCLCVVLD